MTIIYNPSYSFVVGNQKLNDIVEVTRRSSETIHSSHAICIKI